jgi:rare lipoprotein A (peptidoglycan hydrolase)
MRRLRLLSFFVSIAGSAAAVAGCAHSKPVAIAPSIAPEVPAFHEVGLASFYANDLAGRLTANGERYQPDALTAAHRRLPFGTHVRVTARRSGRSVVVRINDRGPYVAGRIIDLSHEAARRIGMLPSGVLEVTVETLPGESLTRAPGLM